MKGHIALLFVTSAVLLAGCGAKKNKAGNNEISSQYELSAFSDVNNTPTYDPALLTKFPRKMDIKEMMTPVKDQGERGTCSFFAAAAIAEAAIKDKMKVDVNLSEEYLNYAAKSMGYNDTDEGGSASRNLYVSIVKKAGFLLERDAPYQPSWFGTKAPCIDFASTDKKAPKECFSHNKPSEAIMANILPGENFEFFNYKTENFTDIIQLLHDAQYPMSMTIPVHDDGLSDDGNITYTEEMRAECIKGSSKCGSHVITITGYDLDKEVFFFKNSWSKRWGNQGYGTLPFSVVDRHVYPQFAMVELKQDLKLPADHQVDYFTLKSFAVDSTENADKSILIEPVVDSEKTGTHALITQSILYKKKKYTDMPLDESNTEKFILSDEDKKSIGASSISNSDFAFQDTDIDKMIWKKEDHKYKFSSVRMSLPSVVKARSSYDEQLVIKSILYIYTDDQGYKPLKTIFHPLNYVHYEI